MYRSWDPILMWMMRVDREGAGGAFLNPVSPQGHNPLLSKSGHQLGQRRTTIRSETQWLVGIRDVTIRGAV